MIRYRDILSWFKSIFKLIFVKILVWRVPSIVIPGYYLSNTNSYIHSISDEILEDIKNKAYLKIKSSKNLLRRVNYYGFIKVTFTKSAPIGAVVNIPHIFYWDDDCLYSLTKESDAIKRSSQIDKILN